MSRLYSVTPAAGGGCTLLAMLPLTSHFISCSSDALSRPKRSKLKLPEARARPHLSPGLSEILL